MADLNYEEKLEKERAWYTQNAFQANHFLNSKLFWSKERNAFNYIFPKNRLALLIEQTMNQNNLTMPSILVAPIGIGDDIQYIKHLSWNISGIDISQEAVDKIADSTVKKYVADMKEMTIFSDNQFDIVLSPLFFHHFVKYGFDDFLKELYRVLKPGGHFFSLEPSSIHPVCMTAWCLKRVVGNITGAVEDEAPFNPLMLSNAMKRCGFHEVQVFGASFSHNRVPIWVAKIINFVTLPLLKSPFVKYFAWMCLFHGRK